jgi:hypothetical protein
MRFARTCKTLTVSLAKMSRDKRVGASPHGDMASSCFHLLRSGPGLAINEDHRPIAMNPSWEERDEGFQYPEKENMRVADRQA